MFILLKVWFLGFRFSTIYLFFISYLPSISKLSSKSFETIHVTEGEEDNALWDTLGDEEDYMSYIEGTFWWYAIISLKSDFSASFIQFSYCLWQNWLVLIFCLHFLYNMITTVLGFILQKASGGKLKDY